MSYYDRKNTILKDGSRSFKVNQDTVNEIDAMARIEDKFNCKCKTPVNTYAKIDFICIRGNLIVSAGELKSRDIAIDEHEDVYLNLRKWNAFKYLKKILMAPIIYYVRFKCGTIKYIEFDDIDPTKIKKNAGCNRVVKSVKNDQEDCILVPISTMKTL